MGATARRTIQVGHGWLPVGELGISAEDWTLLGAAAYTEANRTKALMRLSPQLNDAMALLERQQRTLSDRLLDGTPVTELRADDVRHLIAAARRADLVDEADALARLFNSRPGVIRP